MVELTIRELKNVTRISVSLKDGRTKIIYRDGTTEELNASKIDIPNVRSNILVTDGNVMISPVTEYLTELPLTCDLNEDADILTCKQMTIDEFHESQWYLVEKRP